MTASFGIDHPLLATHDIDELRNLLITLGFNMTPVGRHPWGTSTSLAMFEGCLLEIMGIYDDTLLDEIPAGDFRFGRHVHSHLTQREGVALTALHSTDSQGDATVAMQAGYQLAGHLAFGRDVTLPDGTRDRTKTTLALLPDLTFPRLSFFLCQQHRPELIYVPEWLEHPNGVTGICGVNIVANATDHVTLHNQMSALYPATRRIPDGFECETANGVFRILSPDAFETQIGPLPAALTPLDQPTLAGMDLTCGNINRLAPFIKASGLDHQKLTNGYALRRASDTANTVLRFLAP